MTAPGIPGAFKAAASGLSVILTWTASSNSPERYEIHRGNSETTLASIDEVTGSVTHYTDSDLEAGTYFYKLVARNADGSTDSPIKSVATSEAAIALGAGSFLFYLAIVVAGLILVALLVPFPTFAEDASLSEISGSVGAFLVRFGIILLVLAFIPALIEVLARTFRINVTLPTIFRPTRALNAGGLGEIVLGVVGQFPELLRKPAGYGIAAMLLGVILLVGAAFGFNGEGADASPSPSVGTTTPAPVTPQPGTSITPRPT